jgi:ferritin-like metal-binding protein YciE
MPNPDSDLTPAQHKVLQYLNEAHATEHALVRTLQAHIAVTPRGSYRSGLERHLAETKSQAERIERRMDELGASKSLVQLGLGLVESLVGQALALSRGPFELVRGFSGEEKLLKNAKDECATEALEIATYDAIERLARDLGDEATARLAADIRAEEERMLASLRDEIPKLVDAMVRAELEGDPTYDPATTGLADAARSAGATVRDAARGTARAATGQARRSARQARKVPGVTQAEGEVKGAVASEDDLPIANYDSLNTNEVAQRLGGLSQVDLGKVDAYERRTRNRKSVLERLDSLRGEEPWPGYDELSVDEVRQALSAADDERAAQVRDYERRHKARQGVLEASDRELAKG